jgi:hypothetical protein
LPNKGTNEDTFGDDRDDLGEDRNEFWNPASLPLLHLEFEGRILHLKEHTILEGQ